MSTSKMRSLVLQAFKSLHRTRQTIFNGDKFALAEGRKKINEEYKKCKNVNDAKEIDKLIGYSREVEKELKSTVIQAVEVKPGIYEAHLREELIKMDNVPFRDMPCSSKSPQPKNKSKCGGPT